MADTPPVKRPSDHLEPKEKEHQRKKVLRTFFSWRYRQPITTPQDIRLWTWVKSINPDNSSSEDRYKSISSEFLEKLLEKDLFRRELSNWLKTHENSLIRGEDGEKTIRFIQFLKESIESKDLMDLRKREFLQSLPALEFTQPLGHVIGVFKDVPDAPGLYFEAKCKRAHCRFSRSKGFLSLGATGTYDYSACLTTVKCSGCKGDLLVTGLGFHCCRWGIRGEMIDGERREEASMVAWRYSACEEISTVDWKTLEIRVAGLLPEEYTALQSILLSSLDEQAAKKRPKSSSDFACKVTSLLTIEEERERLDLAATLEQRNREVQIATQSLKRCKTELKRLQIEEEQLKIELNRLKARPRIE